MPGGVPGQASSVTQKNTIPMASRPRTPPTTIASLAFPDITSPSLDPSPPAPCLRQEHYLRGALADAPASLSPSGPRPSACRAAPPLPAGRPAAAFRASPSPAAVADAPAASPAVPLPSACRAAPPFPACRPAAAARALPASAAVADAPAASPAVPLPSACRAAPPLPAGRPAAAARSLPASAAVGDAPAASPAVPRPSACRAAPPLPAGSPVKPPDLAAPWARPAAAPWPSRLRPSVSRLS